jgi:hypothetical protein
MSDDTPEPAPAKPGPDPGADVPDAIARDEAQTERQAPDNASPGEAAGG